MSIPCCRSCRSDALPFAVTIKGGRWRHACGAVVCPSCGGVPQAGDPLCGTCRQLVGAPLPGAVELHAADVVRPAQVMRGCRGR